LMVMNKVLEGERPGRPQGMEGMWFIDDLCATLQLCWAHQATDRPTVETALLSDPRLISQRVELTRRGKWFSQILTNKDRPPFTPAG